MDVDPWQEAAKLMQMPQGAAVEQLESLLGATRNTSRANHDPARIAAVLVALLPRPVNRVHPLLRDLAQARPTKSPDRVSTSTLLSVLAYMTLMLLSNWLMGNLQASRQRQAESAANSASTMDASATQEMTSKMSGPK
jgi:hypothetical protein